MRSEALDTFIFNQKYYKQGDGDAMGCPMEPAWSNVFVCHFKNIYLENFLTQSQPVIYRRYVDDAVLLFRSTEHVEKFKIYINKQQKEHCLYI